jgi:hypothetical protein
VKYFFQERLKKKGRNEVNSLDVYVDVGSIAEVKSLQQCSAGDWCFAGEQNPSFDISCCLLFWRATVK